MIRFNQYAQKQRKEYQFHRAFHRKLKTNEHKPNPPWGVLCFLND